MVYFIIFIELHFSGEETHSYQRKNVNEQQQEDHVVSDCCQSKLDGV